MRFILFFCCAVCMPLLGLQAQHIEASTNAKDVYTNQAFEVSYILQNAEDANFIAPNFSPFQKIAGPFTSSNIRIVNNQRSSSITYSYRLTIDQEGQFQIPPASMVYKNQKYQSKPLSINVLKGTKENMIKGDQLFMELEMSDSVVYVGQQLLLDHSLYFGSQKVKSTALVSEFPRDRFIVHRVSEGSNITARQELYDGKIMNKAHISRLAVFPMRSGEMEVPTTSFEVNVEKPTMTRRGFFRMFDYDSRVFSTPGFNLDIQALPPDTPDKFTGTVGSLDIRLSSQRKQINAGEEILVQATVQGDGIADQFSLPEWDAAAYQVYDPKIVKEELFILDGKINYKKVYEFLVIPKVNGNLDLQFPYSYFDVQKRKYVSTTTNSLRIDVVGEIDEGVDASSKDLMSYRGAGSKAWYAQYWTWGIFSLLAATLIGFFMRPKEKKEEEIPQDPEEAAREVAIKSLSSAKALLDSQQTAKYWETLETAIRIYVEEKLGLNTTDFRKETVVEKWKEVGLDESYLQTWEELDNKINRARYAGQSIENMEKLYEEALNWILELEKAS